MLYKKYLFTMSLFLLSFISMSNASADKSEMLEQDQINIAPVKSLSKLKDFSEIGYYVTNFYTPDQFKKLYESVNELRDDKSSSIKNAYQQNRDILKYLQEASSVYATASQLLRCGKNMIFHFKNDIVFSDTELFGPRNSNRPKLGKNELRDYVHHYVNAITAIDDISVCYKGEPLNGRITIGPDRWGQHSLHNSFKDPFYTCVFELKSGETAFIPHYLTLKLSSAKGSTCALINGYGYVDRNGYSDSYGYRLSSVLNIVPEF